MIASIVSKSVSPATHKDATSNASQADLTRAVFGRELSMAEAWEHLVTDNTGPPVGRRQHPTIRQDTVWVGSIGYERFRDVRDFVRQLVARDVERLIDVRELPISRRRGYAKSALGEAVESAGIEYLHVRALGNPKELRDLYKSGDHEQGRERYEQYLLTTQRPALTELAELLRAKRSALMCVEHDQHICHRDVILSSLRTEVGIPLDVTALA